jgi:hypothetical protein
VRLTIFCRPLKVFWGIAQTYDFSTMPKNVEKLQFCAQDLDTMLKNHLDLGFDLLLSCKDTTMTSIEKTRKKLILIIESVGKTIDVVCYMSGHGYEHKDGSQTYILIRDDSYKADWDTDFRNVMIQKEMEEISCVANNSIALFLIVDICRRGHDSASKDRGSDTKSKLKLSSILKQHMIWWATSSGRLSWEGSANSSKMSLFTQSLHEVLQEVANGRIRELSEITS